MPSRPSAPPRCMKSSTKKAPIIPSSSRCRVVLGTQTFGSAWGPAKKQAEQRAAQIALEELGVLAPRSRCPRRSPRPRAARSKKAPTAARPPPAPPMGPPAPHRALRAARPRGFARRPGQGALIDGRKRFPHRRVRFRARRADRRPGHPHAAAARIDRLFRRHRPPALRQQKPRHRPSLHPAVPALPR